MIKFITHKVIGIFMNKENQRVTFSKELIKIAALKLIKEKDKDDIKVSELCKLADVSRDTFYKHYHTIDDVFKEIYVETITEVTDRISTLSEPKTLKKNLISYLNYIRSKPLLFELLFSSSTKFEEKQKLENEIITTITKLFHNTDEKENEMMAYFLYSGSFAILKKWINNIDTTSTAEVAEFIVKCANKLMR